MDAEKLKQELADGLRSKGWLRSIEVANDLVPTVQSTISRETAKARLEGFISGMHSVIPNTEREALERELAAMEEKGVKR